MAILENGSCVLIEKITPSGVYPIATWVGKHLSLHCTAIGKSVAAHLPEDTLNTLLRQQGMLRHNENTICSVKRLKQELALVRQRKYALDDEEEEISIRCIGAPLFEDGTVIGAISLVGTTNEIHGNTLDGFAAQLIHTASIISEQVRLPDTSANEITGPLRMKGSALTVAPAQATGSAATA
jgi:DNA-binding IclR family transcriptional regulator